MKDRVISCVVFVIIVAAFTLLREFVDYRLFDILICFIAICGSAEICNESKKIVGKAVAVVSIVFGVLLVPVYCLVNYLLFPGMGAYVSIGLLGLCLLINAIITLVKNNNTDAWLFTILDALYPCALILVMLMTNDIQGFAGFVAILLIFVISPLSDVLAFLVGTALKGPKLCPKLSPNKTWAGAIGGLVGGMIGAMLVFFVFGNKLGGNFAWYLFLIVGFIGGLFTILGDLFESAIKRKLGIKDMGTIIPGHGGMLDRIDGISFCSIIVFIAFMIAL